MEENKCLPYIEKIAKKSPKGKEVQFILIGNSFASGYSGTETVIPFMLRNDFGDNIQKLFFKQEKKASIYTFARPQNNDNHSIFEWMTSHTSLRCITAQARKDIQEMEQRYHLHNVPEKAVLDQYYSQKIPDVYLDDLLQKKEALTIILLQGCTGSLINRKERAQTRFKRLTCPYGFTLELRDLQTILTYIEAINPFAQVYVNGLPEYQPNMMFWLMTHGIQCANQRIRLLCTRFKHSIYVPALRPKLHYAEKWDGHPTHEEYLVLQEKYMHYISKNFTIVYAMQTFYQTLLHYMKSISILDPIDRKRLTHQLEPAYQQLLQEEIPKTDIGSGYSLFMKYYHKFYERDFFSEFNVPL